MGMCQSGKNMTCVRMLRRLAEKMKAVMGWLCSMVQTEYRFVKDRV